MTAVALAPQLAAASMPADFLQTAAVATQILFLCAGLVLLWFQILAPAARARHIGSQLPGWNASLTELIVFILHGLSGGFIASFVVGLLAKPLGLAGDPLTIAATASLHLGAVLGLIVHILSYPHLAPSFGGTRVLVSGIATFLIAMPFVYVTNIAWLAGLKALGVDAGRQPAVEMVARLGHSPWLLIFILFAVVVAPVAEELLFRAGLFRFLRSRQRPWIALVVPALLFAAIHLHLPSYLPLAVLGVIFSLSYQRTGFIGTPIVAHGLFNLNNVVMLLAGADK